MILLPTQLQSLMYMVFMGWGYGVVYSFYNRFFYLVRKRFVIYVLEIVFHIAYMLLLYMGLFRINYGVLNLYLWLGFFLGLYVYLRWYTQIFLSLFESFMKVLTFVLKPLLIANSKIFAIIKRIRNKRRRMKVVRKQRRKENKEKKQKNK